MQALAAFELGDHEAAAVIESLEARQKAPRELSVPVEYDPELARKAVRGTESVVPRGTPNADRVRRDRGFHWQSAQRCALPLLPVVRADACAAANSSCCVRDAFSRSTARAS